MIDHQLATHQTISKSIRLNASPHLVWSALTEPEQMKRWMSDGAMEIVTDWIIGSPIVIKVEDISYKTAFTNAGIVLQFSENQVLEYSHLSSISQLADEPQNYTIIRFTLLREENHTLLELNLSNFPDVVHYKHFDFYWSITLEILKQFVEKGRLQ